MLKVLVTGATGFVGRHVCRTLLENGFAVHATGRTPEFPMVHPPLTYFVIENMNSSTQWAPCLQGVDVVIHLASRVHHMRDKGMQALKAYLETNVYGTQKLVKAAIAHDVKRFIYISTVKVLGEQTHEMPLRAEDRPQPQDAYSLSKHKAELLVRELCRRGGMDWVIIRPPLVYGPGVKGNFASLMRLAKTRMPLPFWGVKNRRSYVHVDNLSSLIQVCVTHPNASHEVFLVSDNRDLSTGELVGVIRKLQKRWRLLFPLPRFLITSLAFIFGMRKQVSRLYNSFHVNIEKSMRLLNWTPPVTIEKGLQTMLEGERELTQKMNTRATTDLLITSNPGSSVL